MSPTCKATSQREGESRRRQQRRHRQAHAISTHIRASLPAGNERGRVFEISDAVRRVQYSSGSAASAGKVHANCDTRYHGKATAGHLAVSKNHSTTTSSVLGLAPLSSIVSLFLSPSRPRALSISSSHLSSSSRTPRLARLFVRHVFEIQISRRGKCVYRTTQVQSIRNQEKRRSEERRGAETAVVGRCGCQLCCRLRV